MSDRVLFIQNAKGHRIVQSFNPPTSGRYQYSINMEQIETNKFLFTGSFEMDIVGITKPIDEINNVGIGIGIQYLNTDDQPENLTINMPNNFANILNYDENTGIATIGGDFSVEAEIETNYPSSMFYDLMFGTVKLWVLDRTLANLGECDIGESGYNIAFSLDGTKDSARLVVYSRMPTMLKPYSIVYHENTQTWWIVNKDKVERYLNEQKYDEELGEYTNPTYLYKHSLQLEGAIELLNARDLTDCGFNQNTYTIEQFTRRLFRLSNFEYDSETIDIDTNNSVDISMLVDYIKTYENYSLLSALNDLYSGYNCAVKLSFTINPFDTITGCKLLVVPKSGFVSNEAQNIEDVFTETAEIKQLSKSSYGTSVVSNTDNVVSTITKRYPSVGAVRLYSNEYDLTVDNAVIKLPSKVFKVNEVDMLMTIRLGLQYYANGSWHFEYSNFGGYFNVSNQRAINSVLTTIKNYCATNYSSFDASDFESKRLQMLSTIVRAGTVIFKDGAKFNPQNKTLFYPDGSPIKTVRVPFSPSSHFNMRVAVMDKTSGQSVSQISGTPTSNETYTSVDGIIKWERGSDEISGFQWCGWRQFNDFRVRLTETEYGRNTNYIYAWVQGGNAYRIIIASGEDQNSPHEIEQDYFSGLANKKMPLFAVKYIPMTDLKIKLDNNGTDNNVQLYNQNGKLTDANAFSKMLNSYKKEIEGENITRYLTSHNYNEMPVVGQIINGSNNEKLIINNASYSFTKNENSYFVFGEFTLSRNVATKSLLTSPNTNIRDYGIPQKNNVARKQLYRDFYEFAFTYDIDSDENFYLPIEQILKVGEPQVEPIGHTGIIKLTYEDYVNGSLNYYYQIDSTLYLLKKCIYEVVEFKDNNIIGNDAQNTDTGFDITRVLTGSYQLINTPISYVDKNGRFKDVEISMCNANQLTTIYNKYKSSVGYADDDTVSLQNICLFIPSQVFDYSLTNRDYSIQETNYKKDALEVPVFEYCCQIDDTEEVEVGENILEVEQEEIVIYVAKVFSPNTKSTVNCGSLTIDDFTWTRESETSDIYDYLIYVNNDFENNIYGVDMHYGYDANSKKLLSFTFYRNSQTIIETDDEAKNYYAQGTLTNTMLDKSDTIGKDIVIYKCTITLRLSGLVSPVPELKSTPIFVIHSPSDSNYDIDQKEQSAALRKKIMSLYVNHYKLK